MVFYKFLFMILLFGFGFGYWFCLIYLKRFISNLSIVMFLVVIISGVFMSILITMLVLHTVFPIKLFYTHIL